jgi:hypothetical protein
MQSLEREFEVVEVFKTMGRLPSGPTPSQARAVPHLDDA